MRDDVIEATGETSNQQIPAASQAIPLEWAALLEAMPDAVVVSDVEGSILFANTQFENLTGYAHGELTGQPVEVLVPSSVAGVHGQHRRFYYQHARTRSMGVADDIRARRKDGVEFPVDISLSTIETLRGTIVVSAMRDSTQREESERAARQHARVMAVTVDRERLGKKLLDGVVRQLFEASIGLQGIMTAIDGKSPLTERLNKGVDQIDRAINDIRTYVFDLGTDADEDDPLGRNRPPAEDSVERSND